jgi:segregation and condensation protein B
MNSQNDLFDGVTLHSIVESMIFASDTPISAEDLCRVIHETDERIEILPGDIEQIVGELNDDYNESGRAFEIQHIGGGYTYSTDDRYHKWLQKFQHENVSRKVTPSALEALAIIAYKQPITKPEIDHIRGVDSGYIVRQLLEKELVEVAGRAERPGRPLLYKTNINFLKHFGINTVEELPRPREINEILQDDDMAEHRQIMLELRAELAQVQNGNEEEYEA